MRIADKLIDNVLTEGRVREAVDGGELPFDPRVVMDSVWKQLLRLLNTNLSPAWKLYASNDIESDGQRVGCTYQFTDSSSGGVAKVTLNLRDARKHSATLLAAISTDDTVSGYSGPGLSALDYEKIVALDAGRVSKEIINRFAALCQEAKEQDDRIGDAPFYEVDVTFSTVTPLDGGDDGEDMEYDEDDGYERQDIRCDDLQEVVRIMNEYGASQWDGHGSSFYSVDPSRDYQDGSETTYAVHVRPEGKRANLTPGDLAYLKKSVR